MSGPEIQDLGDMVVIFVTDSEPSLDKLRYLQGLSNFLPCDLLPRPVIMFYGEQIVVLKGASKVFTERS